MRIALALAVMLVAVSSAGAATAPLYGGFRYDGRATCASRASLTVNETTVALGRYSHTALWSGVSTPDATAWLQAGLTSDTGVVYAYIEYAVGKRYTMIRLGVTSTATVELAHRGDAWTVTLGTRSETVRLPRRTTCFVGAESADWGHRNVLRGDVSIDGGAAFGVALG